MVSNPKKDDPRENNHRGIDALKLATDVKAALAQTNVAHG